MARSLRSGFVAALASLVAVAGASAQPHYRVTNLVSDGTIPAAHMDPLLVNSWGIAFNPTGFVWVADADSGHSTLYDGHGNPQMLIVEIPSIPNSTERGSPTGIVFSGGSDFVVRSGMLSGAARFIFATEEGTLSAWSPQVDMTHAHIVADATPSEASFKGLTLAAAGSGHRLYATDFHNARVLVFDGDFNPITVDGRFLDPTIPPRFAPFGIQAVDDRIFVTYAMQDAQGEDEVRGQGLGYVNVFDVNGFRLERVASRGVLNAPWGIAVAPHDFGHHSDELLIGNFGDGRINAFAPNSGPAGHQFVSHGRLFNSAGPLLGDHGPIRIDGLWGMAFGNDRNDQPHNTLFFASGPDEESH